MQQNYFKQQYNIKKIQNNVNYYKKLLIYDFYLILNNINYFMFYLIILIITLSI